MSIINFLNYHANMRGDTPMLKQDDQVISYAEARESARRIANGLAASGIGKGDRVAILGQNSTDHILLFLGAAMIGAVMTPLNFRLAPGELTAILADAQAPILVVNDPDLKAETEALLGVVDSGITVIGAAAPDAPSLAEWMAGYDATASEHEIEGSDILLQLYTSGTTGLPKGVMLTHDNVLSLHMGNTASLRYKSGVGTTALVVAPFFHIGGFGWPLLSIISGECLVIHSQFDPHAVVDAMESQSVNALFMVPAMIQAVLATVPDIRERDFSNLKQMVYGAAPISPALLAEAMEVFKCDFCQAYGMTETTGGIVLMTAEDHIHAIENEPELLLSCGRPSLGAEIRIIDDDGNILPAGETGQIITRSPSVMAGYWNRPEETAKTLRDGWIHTGDAGMMDERGFLFIRDRIKDMVVTGGENVYPVEVEKVLANHPAILEVAVIGVPDEKFGEALLAICACHDGKSVTTEELIDFCRSDLAGYKIPRQTELVEALPRNGAGKVQKHVLREPYWAEGRQVG